MRLLLTTGLTLLWTASAYAGITTIEVPNSSLLTHQTADSTVAYYSLAVPIPQGFEGVVQAWLEIKLDVSHDSMDGFIDPAPILEVFMLAGPVSGQVSESSLASTRLPMSRPVSIGENRLVRVDVTEFIQRVLRHPQDNYGLVFGTVLGSRERHFLPRLDSFGAGTVARLVLVR